MTTQRPWQPPSPQNLDAFRAAKESVEHALELRRQLRADQQPPAPADQPETTNA